MATVLSLDEHDHRFQHDHDLQFDYPLLSLPLRAGVWMSESK